jgi:hypothetical protein
VELIDRGNLIHSATMIKLLPCDLTAELYLTIVVKSEDSRVIFVAYLHFGKHSLKRQFIHDITYFDKFVENACR